MEKENKETYVNMNVYRYGLTMYYKYVLDFLYKFGGKYCLYKKETLINDLMSYYQKSEKEIKKSLSDLIKSDLLIEHKATKEVYVYFSTRLYREYFNNKVSVYDINNFYSFNIHNLKIEFIKNTYTLQGFEKSKFNNIFNNSDSNISFLYDKLYKTENDELSSFKFNDFNKIMKFLTLNNIYLTSISKEENKYLMSFSLFVCDKENSSINNIFPRNYKKIVKSLLDLKSLCKYDLDSVVLNVVYYKNERKKNYELFKCLKNNENQLNGLILTNIPL